MEDLTRLTTAVANLEAQAKVNNQLIQDLLAALKNPSTSQAEIDALAKRVEDVTSGEAAADTAGAAGLPGAGGGTPPVSGLAASYPDRASFDAAVAAMTGPDEVTLDGATVHPGTAAGGHDAYFTHSDSTPPGQIDTTGPTS